jgi:hypothetical protein
LIPAVIPAAFFVTLIGAASNKLIARTGIRLRVARSAGRGGCVF